MLSKFIFLCLKLTVKNIFKIIIIIVIKVPVVATVIQSFDEKGKMRIDVEPPCPEIENQNNEVQKNVKKNVAYKVEPSKTFFLF